MSDDATPTNYFNYGLRDGLAEMIRATGKPDDFLAAFLRNFDRANAVDAAFAEFVWRQMAFNIKVTEAIVAAAADDRELRNLRLRELVKQLSSMQGAVTDAVTSILAEDQEP